MKKSAIFLKAVSKTTGLLAVLLTLALVLAGCDNGSGGGPDSALVAKLNVSWDRKAIFHQQVLTAV
jgi:predicted small secreted protein